MEGKRIFCLYWVDFYEENFLLTTVWLANILFDSVERVNCRRQFLQDEVKWIKDTLPRKEFFKNIYLNFILNRYVCWNVFCRRVSVSEKTQRKTNFGEGVNLINFFLALFFVAALSIFAANIIEVSITCRSRINQSDTDRAYWKA